MNCGLGCLLANAEANAMRVDKDRITSHRLSLSLSPSLQTDVATYRAAYGLSPLSIISLWKTYIRDRLTKCDDKTAIAKHRHDLQKKIIRRSNV